MVWNDWLNKLTPQQRTDLENTIRGTISGKVSIVRANLEDFLYTKSPPYVDVFNLLPLYQKLIFRKNLLIKGPKGDGKSLSIVSLATYTQTPLITQPCSEDTKKRDLIGSFFIQGDKTPFMLGTMATAIDIANEYGRAILAFEEVNALTPQTQKQLNEFLDFRKSVSIPQIGKTYRLREGAQLWVVAMMNNVLYGGTYQLNEDFRSRWTEVEIGYPTMEQEKQILEANGIIGDSYNDILEGCVSIAAQTRDKHHSFNYSLSTRDVVGLAETILLLGFDEALQLLSHKFEGRDHELIATRISSTFRGAPRVKDKWNSVNSSV